MTINGQAATVDFLSAPQSRDPARAVEIIETHISYVFLHDTRVWKLKRAVKLPYVDFSTPALRLAACEKEVTLNARTAPGLYLGVRRITREADGSLAFDGTGVLVDAVVEMVRFDQSQLLDRMALAGTLTPRLMMQVAQMVATFHENAPVIDGLSGAANMAAVLDINEAGFATSNVFSSQMLMPFNAAFRASLDHHSALLDRRAAAGRIRRCHGDLHLRNICLLDGEPRLFDCIEFNDEIATIDVLYDLAFLLMDLWHRNLSDLANLTMNRYLDLTGDDEGFVLLPFFMAIRAAVRAHVTATQIAESDTPQPKLVAEAESYFALARSLLETTAPRLIAIGGLSGSGKSTIADALASHVGAPPGARVLESDRIRKAMHGVAIEAQLPQSAYRPEISRQVYDELARRSARIIADGGSVIVDAVFDRAEDRKQIEAVAGKQHVPFAGIWLDANAAVLRQRVRDRPKGASDATLDVLEKQLKDAPADRGWRNVDTTKKQKEVLENIRTVLEQPASNLAKAAALPKVQDSGAEIE